MTYRRSFDEVERAWEAMNSDPPDPKSHCFVCGKRDYESNLSLIDDIELCGGCAAEMVREL